ncbi:MAG: hypothetical protein KY476_05040 [Planctomycetes bacterium]|nr:hypothetical protein [Planctomycetota bacterium]
MLSLGGLLFGASPAEALDVEQVRWGFDGRIVPGRFNVLSIELSNPTPLAFDDVVRLELRGGPGGRAGAPVVRQVYLGPFERSRWVQFYPWIHSEYDDWVLRWRGGAYDISQQRGERPPFANDDRPVAVLLHPPGRPPRRAGGLAVLPDDHFPPFATACDALDVVVLSHVPRWQEARQTALRDWLHAGGRLHLAADETGVPLEFPTELAELNRPESRFSVGRGTVVRHAEPLASLRSEEIRGSILAAESAAVPAAQEAEDGNVDDTLSWKAQQFNQGFSQNVFETLKLMTRPDHNWGLIYLMAFLYLGLVFPGFYLLGRRRLDYRMIYGGLIATVAVFSLGFAMIGRRGYGEATTVNSVAVARPLPGGWLDVTGWSNAFVTSGDEYLLRHGGAGVLYTTAQDYEPVQGAITNPPGARFLVDIPPYSDRTFHWRMKVQAAAPRLSLSERNPAGGRITIEVDGAFDQPQFQAFAMYQNSFCKVEQSLSRLIVHTSSGQLITSQAAETMSWTHDHYRYGYDSYRRRSVSESYHSIASPLVLHTLGFRDYEGLSRAAVPPDRVRVFLYLPMPPEFFIQNPTLGRQQGFVLYVSDVELNVQENETRTLNVEP